MAEPYPQFGASIQPPADVHDDLRFENWREARCEPDLVLPVQFNDLIRRRRYADGEVRLALAVLEDAIRTRIKCAPPRRSRAGKKAFQEVSDWFNSRAHNPFSFEYICELLDMDSDALRQRLNYLTIDDLPTKQTHSVGRRHTMSPRVPGRRRSRLQRNFAARPGNATYRSASTTAIPAGATEQPD